MLIGIEPPEWANKLLDQWVEFDDYVNGVQGVIAFVYYADLLSWETDTKMQVRIFATLLDTAKQEAKTGQVEVGSGIYATHIVEGTCKIIPVPEGLEEWTRQQVSENQKNDSLGLQ